MAIGLSNAFVTLFDAEVKQAYQGKAQLVGAVRQRRGVEGSVVKFPKVGKGVATLRVPQTDVTPLNAGWSQVTATLDDIGTADSNLNVAKLREAKRLLDKNNVPPEGRHIVIHGNNLSSLLSETAVTSSDFNTVKALVAGELNTFLGFTFHVLGDRSEGGLAIDGSLDRTVFAFHKDSIGYAEGIAPKTEINYIPEKTSFLVNAIFSATATTIDAEGIVQLTCRESA